MKLKNILLLLIIVVYSNSKSLGQDGLLDPTFNSIGAFNGKVYETKVQSDGKIISIGEFTNFRDRAAAHICRLNSDGTYDDSFVYGTGISGEVYCIEIQSDGKILLGGHFYSYNDMPTNYAPVIRLNEDGTLDNSFDAIDHTFAGPRYMGSIAITDLLIQPTGKIIAVGDFDFTIKTYTSPTTYTTYVIQDIIRLNTNGTYDNTFNIGTGSDASPRLVGVQAESNGSLIIVGGFTKINGINRNKICRVDSEGNLDLTYNPTTFSYGSFQDFQIDANNKVTLVGNFTLFDGQSVSNIIRINTDGTIDNTFNCLSPSELTDIEIQSNGKYIISGEGKNSIEANYTYNLVRLNTNGSFDATFTYLNFSIYEPSSYTAITIQSDDKILVGGAFNSYNNINCNNMVRLNLNGDVDIPFHHAKGSGGGASIAKTLPDGKILLAGTFGIYNNEIQNIVCRLNSDGTVDETFNSGTGFHYNSFGTDLPQVNSIVLQSDGKYFVCGRFQEYNGVNQPFVTRINTNGSIDNSLSLAGGVNHVVNNGLIQPDNKIVLVGKFDKFYDDGGWPYSANHIIRLNSDGSLDNDFFLNKGTGTDLEIFTSCLQADGKILIGGQMTSFNGTPCGRMARLNSDGTIDNTFNIGTGANNWVQSIQMINDGRILITGMFGSFNGTPAGGLAILNTDGSVDASFATFSHNGAVSCVYQQQDHKLLVGGVFSNLGSNHINLIRLNQDGTIDPTFNTSAPEGFLNNIYPYDESRVIINTNMYDHYTINGICRVFIDETSTNISKQESVENNMSFTIYPNPLHNNLLNIRLDKGFSTNNKLTIYSSNGVMIYEKNNVSHEFAIPSSKLTNGIYLIKLTDLKNNVVRSQRLIVE